MRFEYSLTIKDLAESYRPFLTQRQTASLRRGLVLWILVSFVAVGLFFAASVWTSWRCRHAPPVVYPVQNFWVTSAPSMLPVSMMIVAMLLGAYRNHRRIQLAKKGFLHSQQTPAKLAGLFTVIPMILFIVLPTIPALAIEWKPSPAESLWAAYLPWIFVSMIVLLLGPLSRRRGAVSAWYRRRSLQRNVQLEVTAEAIAFDTGLVQTRWQWAAIDRYRESKNLIILITEDEHQLLIPKRVAEDPAALDSLYALIQNSVSDGEFLAREMRFPVLPRPVIPLAA